ncbi:hypothetical protein PLICRDRAFT_100963 [Plicaturopsis crispa FD-325 SS-3]|nr:hypothetical protein PLICRDRAFT_100963 [Plicaturopsis crispa FD-325 SS-3]
MSIRTDRVRAVICFKRKEGLSKEEFDAYWLEHHAPLFSSVAIVKKNILKYEQAHLSEAAQQASSLPTLPFDGIVTLETESFEKLLEVYGDPEYARVVVPDEERFMDRLTMQVFPATVATVMDK